jgi:membrane protease YdiL (CAAX protease family)
METNDTTKQTKRSRLAYFLRAFGYFVVLALVNLVAYNVVADSLSGLLPSWTALLVGNLAYLLGVVGLTWAFCRYLDRTSLRSLGLQRQGWLPKLGTGWALGMFLQLLIFVAFAVAGWLTVERAPWQPLELAASTVSWLIMSFNEELAFRGYIMQRLSQAWGMPAAVVASSLIFAMVHTFNPGFRPLAMVSLFVAGLLLACAYLVSRSLWLPIGVHIGWNLMQAQILGFPSSGSPEPAILRVTTTGPEVMTGGVFGPEGGILGIVAPLIGIVILLVGYRIALASKRRNLSGGINER